MHTEYWKVAKSVHGPKLRNPVHPNHDRPCSLLRYHLCNPFLPFAPRHQGLAIWRFIQLLSCKLGIQPRSFKVVVCTGYFPSELVWVWDTKCVWWWDAWGNERYTCLYLNQWRRVLNLYRVHHRGHLHCYLGMHHMSSTFKLVVCSFFDLSLENRSNFIKGTMMTRHPPKNCFPEALQNAIKTWTNLCSIRFTTMESYDKLFTEPLRLLRDISSLHTVHLGGTWLDEERVPILVELERLKNVSIVSPSRAMLSSLPGWLRKLEENLIQLHLLVSTRYQWITCLTSTITSRMTVVPSPRASFAHSYLIYKTSAHSAWVYLIQLQTKICSMLSLSFLV